MLEKIKEPLGFGKGLITALDPGLLPEGASPQVNNLWAFEGYLRRAPGTTYFDGTDSPPGTSPSLPVLGIVPYYSDEVFQYYVAFVYRSGGGNSVYKIDEDGAWTLLGTGTFSPNSHLRTYQESDNLWFATPVQAVQYWDGTSLNVPTDLTNIYAQDLKVFYNHMLLARTEESSTVNRYRIRWSVFNDFTDWTGETSGYLDLDYTPGEVVGIGRILDRLFVFKQDSIWEIIYVGGTTVFSAQPVIGEVGCLAVESITEYKQSIFFVGSDDIYVFDGRQIEAIGAPLQDTFFGITSQTSNQFLKFAKGTYSPRTQELWLGIAKGDNFPVDLYCYKVTENAWWPMDYDEIVYSLVYATDLDKVRWEEVQITWAAETRTWDDTTLTSARQSLLVGSNSDVTRKDYESGTHLGTYPTGVWYSPLLNHDWSSRWMMFQCEMRGTAGATLEYSTDEGSSWTSAGAKTPSSDTEWDRVRWSFDTTAETIQFRITWGSGDTELKRLQVHSSIRKGDR